MPAAKTPAKKSYNEMIEDTLVTLSDKGGSSRQTVWKAMSAKFPDTTYKLFLVRLQKAAKEGTTVTFGKNNQRYTLAKKLKDRVRRANAAGKPIESSRQLHAPRKTAVNKAALASKKRAAAEKKKARKAAMASKKRAKKAAAAEKKKAAKAKKAAAI